MLDRLLVFQDREPRNAALNMAIDEALLEKVSAPALRFYQWARPALSFGYFGKIADAKKIGADREVMRRWTGGGIVLHGEDLTYSFVVPNRERTSITSAHEFYRLLHLAMQQALRSVGVLADFVNETPPKISEACFANPVTADLLVNGRKIAGAAQRRTRAGLLQQGSIQFEKLPADFPRQFAATLFPRFKFSSLSPELLTRAEEIAAAKYATTAWLNRR